MLLHRGYPIDELAEKSSFLEVCYLLLHGELPKAGEFAEFDKNITYHTMLHEQFDRFFQGFRRDAHPMAIMLGAVGALSAFYHDSTNVDDPEQRMISAHRLIAKMPTIAARGLQVLAAASRSCIRATTCPTPRTSCACASRSRPRTGSRTRS